MIGNQKEALIIALAEKGESYRTICKQAHTCPNTIKAVLNKAGLDESASESSRAFELYVKQKTPVEVAIELNLEAEKAIRLYHDYFMLLGITGFTQVYLQIKDDPTRFVNLFNLAHNAGLDNAEIVELLRIANGCLPRVRLEYDRLVEKKNWLETELKSRKCELDHVVRIYQDFCDRNLRLRKREDELHQSINELEAKRIELQNFTAELNHSLVNQKTNTDKETEQEIVRLINVLSSPLSNLANSYHQNENETSSPEVEPSSKGLNCDTKNLFLTSSSLPNQKESI